MVKKESNICSTIIISDPKNEKLRKKLKNILPTITKNREEKSKNFIKSISKFRNDENCKFNHLLIERYFLFKAVEEMNEKLIKNNERFLLYNASKLHEFFDAETGLHLLMNWCITKDGEVSRELIDENFYQLNLVIKKHVKDEKFISGVDKLETNLPVIYTDMA